MILLAENEIGFLLFDGNELTIGSKIDDPAKLRLTAPTTEHGGGGGCVSFNRSNASGVVCDGHSQGEMAMLRVEQAEDVRGDSGNLKAEFNFLLNNGGGGADSNMEKPLAFTSNALTRLAGFFGGLFRTSETRTAQMWSPSGVFLTQMQDDGNFVTYDMSGPTPKAVWSAWTGAIR